VRRQITTNELTWIDVIDPTQEDGAFLSREFHFHPLDIQELTQRSPRPKVEEHPGYLFLVVHIPIYEPTSRATVSAEVDVFVTHAHVITVHLGLVHILDRFFHDVNKQETTRERYVGRGAAYLLYSIMDTLTEASFPKLDHVLEKIEAAERRIFAGEERAMVLELSAIQRDLSGFRYVLRPQVHLYDAGTLHGEFATPLFQAVFRSISAKLARAWDALETLQEKVQTLSETNTSVLSHKLNEFIKVLTLLGALFIPFGLIAQVVIFLGDGVPLTNLVIFWSIIGGMLLVDVVLLWYSRHRKLL
jgi:magnesium transporter